MIYAPITDQEFVNLASVIAKDERPPYKIKRDEKDYFRYLKPGSEAVARKLTVMMELSDGLVADRRLWRWLESCFKK